MRVIYRKHLRSVAKHKFLIKKGFGFKEARVFKFEESINIDSIIVSI